MTNCFCRCCFNYFDIALMKKGSVSGKGRGICKKCNSKMAYNLLLRKLAKQKRTMECNSCDELFFRHAKGRYETRKECPHCGSDNINILAMGE